MKSNQYLRYITIALSLLVTFAVTVIWHAPRVRAGTEHATAATPALQGNAALEHLKQQGLYSSLRTAMNAVLPPNFTQLTEITAFDGQGGDIFGYSVAMSGNTVVIGAAGGNGPVQEAAGAAYVFVRSGTSYAFQGKLTAPDGAYGDEFGLAVAISGNTIVIGANHNNSGHGAAYVFVRSGTNWSQQQKLVDSAWVSSDYFGKVVVISGDTIGVGVPSDEIGSNHAQGSVHVFTRSGALWSRQQKLTAADGSANGYFGTALAISGNTLLVGAHGDRAAYVFARSGTSWNQQQKFLANDQSPSYYGATVALDNDTALIGAPYENAGEGAVYVYVRSGSSWSQQQRLANAEPAGYVSFGRGLAIYGDTVVVGAPAYFQSSQSGSAYIFTRAAGTWSQQQKLTTYSPADNFGHSLALGLGTLVVGSYGKDHDRGAAIVFAAPVNTPPTLSTLPITRSASSPSVVASIGQVSDAEDAENTLPVTLASNPTNNGVTLSGLSVDSAGVVSATIATACNATTASFSLSVIDSGGAFNVATLTVTVPPNTAPTLGYASPQIISLGSGAKIIPATGLSDNGTITSLVLQSVTPGFSGSINLNASGVVAVGNAGPAGNYTVVVRATDNCGATRDATFTLTVPGNCSPQTISPSVLSAGRVGLNYQQSLSVTASGVVQYTYSLVAGSGALPHGLQLSPQGVLSGTPTQAGSFQFTIRATGSNGCLVARTYNLTVLLNMIIVKDRN